MKFKRPFLCACRPFLSVAFSSPRPSSCNTRFLCNLPIKQCWARVLFLSTPHRVMTFYRRVTRHRVNIIYASSLFRVTRHIFSSSVLNVHQFKRQHGRTGTATFHPYWRSYSTLLLLVILHPPPLGHPPLLPLETISSIRAVNLYPSCWSNS